ncbi:MAG TPA: FAD:protein FMN transferase [Steroidobacteraceae bacterium]|nr:FAD:protein FMN transferase [Steroidobacteraceae bacterium]
MIDQGQGVITFQRVRPALGTLVAVEAGAPDDKVAQRALAAAFDAVDQVARLMHPVAVGSDAQQIACAALNRPLTIHPWTWQVLRLARELHTATQGLFDPCLAHAAGRMTALELGDDHTVICRAPAALDLGGIAKGFAVDRAVDALQAHGCRNGVVNAGGDLRVFGDLPQSVLLRTAAGSVAPLQLVNAALAVSAPRCETSPREHRGFYRGTTGESIEGRWVAVTAAEAAIADGLTKCALVCPAPMLESILESYGARLVNVVA